MDFFATGGFQQLFSDLDEPVLDQDLQSSTLDISNYITFAPLQLSPTEQKCSPLLTASGHIDIYENSDELFGSQMDTISSCAYYELISIEEEQKANKAKENQFINSENETSDWNNNSYRHDEFHVNEKQLQRSLDLILPSGEDDCDAEEDEAGNQLGIEFCTDYFITREMSDWEERFLDNYIEIPELVDFLPEKTPLCTDECESFLQESSKNLRLHRKRKQNQSCDTLKSGYICTFGNCQKVYAKPAHLKAHLRRHLGEKPYVCNWPDCTWKFSRSDELARHRRSHSGVKPYKCDYCTKCFARSDHLTKHRKVHERRLLAASKAGKVIEGEALPNSILTVRPGRKRKNQIC